MHSMTYVTASPKTPKQWHVPSNVSHQAGPPVQGHPSATSPMFTYLRVGHAVHDEIGTEQQASSIDSKDQHRRRMNAHCDMHSMTYFTTFEARGPRVPESFRGESD